MMKRYTISLFFAIPLFALNNVRQEIGTDYYHNRGFKGQGIACAVIDDVDITFNDFRDPVTHQTRVLAYKRYFFDSQGIERSEIWDSAKIDSLLNAKFPYIQYHAYDSLSPFHNRRNDHGTIIANIMAGNGSSVLSGNAGTLGLVGMAPESKLIIISKPKTGSLTFIDSVAKAHGMPWVTNISWTQGPDDEIRALTGKGKRGKAVVVGSGNDNYKNFKKLIFQPGDTLVHFPFQITPLSKYTLQAKIGNFTVYFYRYMTSFNLTYTGASPIKTRFNTQFSEKKEFSQTDHMAGDSIYFLRANSDTSVYEIFQVKKHPDRQSISFYAQTQRTNDWSMDFVKTASQTPETLNVAFSWETHNDRFGLLPQTTLDTIQYTLVDLALVDETIVTGGNYHHLISGTPDTLYQKDAICFYSSVGPLFNGTIRPDIVAPAHGMGVLSVSNSGDTNAISNLVYYGTSFSAPLAAGALALLLQEDTTRDVEDLRQILHSRAHPNAFTGNLPNPVYGYGVLNLNPSDTRIAMTPSLARSNFGLTAFPNPFKGTVSLEASGLRAEGAALLTIYDVRGKTVAAFNLVTHSQKAVWQPKNFPSGVYLARLSTKDRISSLKLVLAR